MKSLLTKDLVVLDVTSRLISAIVGVKKAQSVFCIKSDVEEEYPGFADGEWFDENETVRVARRVISEAMKAADSNSKRLFIGVPAEFVAVVSKEVEVCFDRNKRIVDEDIDYLIEKGMEAYGSDYVVINTSAVYYTVNGGGQCFDDVRGMYAGSVGALVTYMLAEKRFVKLFDNISESLGFKDIRYVCSGWAECISLLEHNQREDAFVLIDVGYLSTSVAYAKGKGLLDLKSFSMGGGHIAGDIFEQLEVPFELAKDAKNAIDLNLNYSEDAILVSDGEYSVLAAEANEVVKNRLEVFAEIFKEIFDGFDGLQSYTPIYLTGEGIANVRGAKKFLSEKLERNIEILMPTLPGFVNPESSSEISLLSVADSLAPKGFGAWIKNVFSGGKQ